MPYSKKCKMDRCREKQKGGKNKTEHGCCYLEGGTGVSTGVSHPSNMHISLCTVFLRFVYLYTSSTRAAFPLIGVYVCVHQCIMQVCSCICKLTKKTADSYSKVWLKQSYSTSHADNSEF